MTTTTTGDRLIHDYLRSLGAHLRTLPRRTRREVLDEIRRHIAEERASGHGDAEVGVLLQRLGDPATIAEEARARLSTPRPPLGLLAGAALVLIGFSGLLSLDLFNMNWTSYGGWLLGVVLLCFTRPWTRGEKAAAAVALFTVTVVLPAAAQAAALWVGPACPIGDASCGQPGNALLTAVPALSWGVLPVAIAVWLALRARRPAPLHQG